MIRLHGQHLTVEELRARGAAIIEKCRNQRVTLVLEREKLRMSAMLRDHETRMSQSRQHQREMDHVVHKLLKSVSSPEGN